MNNLSAIGKEPLKSGIHKISPDLVLFPSTSRPAQ